MPAVDELPHRIARTGARGSAGTAAGRPAAPDPGAPRSAVPAVQRAVRLLDTLAEAPDPLSLAELAARLRLPKSTVHGLCATLVHTGLVTRFENGAFHLGLHVVDLAHAFLARTDLTVEFVRLWESLAILPEETIVLSVLDGADVVYVGCRNGSRPLGLNFRIGMRLPANCTASGKAILSTLPAPRVKELVGAAGLRALTKKTSGGMSGLVRQLAQARKLGYAVDDGETAEGMICYGAPVFDSRSGEAVAGVGVSLLKAAVSARRRALAAQAVCRMAQALSRRLGAREASSG
jgi:DNA-binding IclR family transcriptional regulator